MSRARRADAPASVEWPTALLAVFVYGGWLALTWFHAALPWWLLAPLGGWFVAWQSSLQHEMVHGHFTPWPRVNYAVAYPPLMLWMPYDRYRATHLTHHRDEDLTHAGVDPESRYWRAADLAALGTIGRTLARAENTMLGRISIGPIWVSLRFLWSEARAIVAGDRVVARAWLKTLPGIALVLAWASLVCGMGVWTYLFFFVLPGTALMLIRSFAEHRAVPEVARRTVVVENTPAFALLYLNNNLHATHHLAPAVAWYRLPALHRAQRGEFMGAGVRFYRGYAEVFRRFLVRSHDRLLHPSELAG